MPESYSTEEAAREGARAAAVGATPATLDTRIAGAAPTINAGQLNTTYEYRVLDETSGTWGNWQTLGSNGTANNAAGGDQIRISIEYPHQLVTGGLFAGLADDPESGTIMLNTDIVMQRE